MQACRKVTFYDRDAVREPHNDLPNGDRFQGRAGVSHADYEARKWTARSDGIARPPVTMRRREYHPLGRPLRSVWAVNPQPLTDGQHLAAFAEALVVPMVLAGTSGRGCCPRCGAPWRRNADDWEPGCRHEHAPVPCTALDPFAGAGTTPLVAQRLGRNAIGIELSPTYLEQARKRIAAEHGQMRLFGTAGAIKHRGREADQRWLRFPSGRERDRPGWPGSHDSRGFNPIGGITYWLP
jgi:site-specific DNA-methyltransferase (adenine-specific)